MIGGYLVVQIDKASLPIGVCMIDLVLTMSEVLGEQRGAQKTKGAEGREEQYGEVCSGGLLAAPGGTV
jgi:hypothetical protein